MYMAITPHLAALVRRLWCYRCFSRQAAVCPQRRRSASSVLSMRHFKYIIHSADPQSSLVGGCDFRNRSGSACVSLRLNGTTLSCLDEIIHRTTDVEGRCHLQQSLWCPLNCQPWTTMHFQLSLHQRGTVHEFRLDCALSRHLPTTAEDIFIHVINTELWRSLSRLRSANVHRNSNGSTCLSFWLCKVSLRCDSVALISAFTISSTSNSSNSSCNSSNIRVNEQTDRSIHPRLMTSGSDLS